MNRQALGRTRLGGILWRVSFIVLLCGGANSLNAQLNITGSSLSLSVTASVNGQTASDGLNGNGYRNVAVFPQGYGFATSQASLNALISSALITIDAGVTSSAGIAFSPVPETQVGSANAQCAVALSFYLDVPQLLLFQMSGGGTTVSFSGPDTNFSGTNVPYSFFALPGSYSLTVLTVSSATFSGGTSLPPNPFPFGFSRRIRSHFTMQATPVTGPQIVSIPPNKYMVIGSSNTLTVQAYGTPPLAYQWIRNGTALTGATNTTLFLHPVSDAMSGSYTVVVTNAVGAVTSSVVNVLVFHPMPSVAQNGGTVFSSPGPEVTALTNGQVLTLLAAPDPGWKFLQWLGEAQGTNAVTTLRVRGTPCVRAVFGTPMSAVSSPSGSVLMEPMVATYPYGSMVRLTAVPSPGNHFASWSSPMGSTNNPLLFVVTNATPSLAAFHSALDGGFVALTVSATGSGQIGSYASRYPTNQLVLLRAIPDPGQDFLGWSGDASGSETNLSVVLNQNKVIAANFTKRPSLFVDPCGGGRREDGFQFTLNGDFGARYNISYSTNLLLWSPLVTLTNFFGISQFLDSATTNQRMRFYRAVVAP